MQTFALGGVPGTIYNVTFDVRGIVESKNYAGGMRRAGLMMRSAPPDNAYDLWQEGGVASSTISNTFELQVSPPVSGAANHYFLNARNGSGEDFHTWKVSYSATLRVPGGGTLVFRSHDPDCTQFMNCGLYFGILASGCVKPGSVDVSAVIPPVPASFVQPFVGTGPSTAPGQWMLFDVTKVDVAAL